MAKNKSLVGEAGPETLVKPKAEPAAHPVPVEGAVVPDPLAVVPHEAGKGDVAIRVPKTSGAYGLMEDGRQIVHDVAADDEGGRVMVHPDHVANFLRSVEGSKLIKPPQLTAEQEAIEANRPQGRVTLAPLSEEETAAAKEQARLAAATTTREAVAAKSKASTAAKK